MLLFYVITGKRSNATVTFGPMKKVNKLKLGAPKYKRAILRDTPDKLPPTPPPSPKPGPSRRMPIINVS